jgi:tRNA A37 threonylcarbamoyladenosine dehydratase
MLGDEPIQALMSKNVLVVGLGGVGGICAEMIARAGVGKMTRFKQCK